MALAAGSKLGPYEVLSLIGAGGMGEVYRAKDTKLKRDVALKVLPDAFARDPERMARFQREAEVLASLNHPNIAQIYGVEDRALVMELVEGETLAGPLPLDVVLNYARQITEGLEYAHERAIVHRDLIPEAGGAPQPLTKLQRGDGSHRWPQVLAGANAVLFTVGSPGNFDEANIEVLSLTTGETKLLIRGGYFGRYLPAPGSAGYLVYLHQGVLFGLPFDPVKLAVGGTPAPLLEELAGNVGDGGGQFDVSGPPSGQGTLVYLKGKSTFTGWPVAWLDSSGKTQPLLAKPGVYNSPRFSPDGNWLALAVNAGKGLDLFVYDWHHDTMPRLTFNGRTNRDPVWTPDGKHIAFDSTDGLYWMRADGAGEPQRLLESKNVVIAFSFSPDSRRLSYTEQSAETNLDLWTLALDVSDAEHPKPGKPEPFLRTPATEFSPMFSPDGRWMAYTSNESGANEVYVRPFPGPGGKWQISSGGGLFPIWSRNGRELFYAAPENRILVTEYGAKGESFSYAKPRQWSDKPLLSVGGRPYFDLAPDGKRFAVFPTAGSNDERQGNVHVTFLLNFFDEVRRRLKK